MQPSPVASAPSRVSSGSHFKSSVRLLSAVDAPTILLSILVFAVTLGLSLCQHLVFEATRSTFFGDSRHYLESCRQLVAMANATIAGLLSGQMAPILLSKSLSAQLMLDGPILPLLPTFFFVLSAKQPTPLDWQSFVTMGSAVHALSAVFLFLLAQRITRNPKWAAATGIAYGAYPAAVIASGRFLTETPTALILLALVFSAAAAQEDGENKLARLAPKGVVLGLLAGLILLIKPVLFPAAALVSCLALMFVSKRAGRIKLAASCLIGLCLLIVPFALFAKATTGRLVLTPQRVPAYNAAKGCDLESDGWGARPYPPMTEIFNQSQAVLPTIMAAWSTDPGGVLNLTLRKPARLWALPWNDFRASYFGLSYRAQAWIHALVLILAVVGALSMLARLPETLLPRQAKDAGLLVGYASMVIVAGHLLYLPFEAISRYGFTSMPFAFLLASYALFVAYRIERLRLVSLAIVFLLGPLIAAPIGMETDKVAELFQDIGSFTSAKLTGECILTVLFLLASFIYAAKATPDKAARIIARTGGCTIALLMLLAAVAFANDRKLAHSTSIKLAQGESACRRLSVPQSSFGKSIQPQLAAVLVDCDAFSGKAQVSVNGHFVKDDPELLFRLRPSRFYLLDLMRTMAAQLGKPLDELRQWRIVTFPASMLNLHGTNVIRVINQGNLPLTIYGARDDLSSGRRYHTKSIDYFSSGLFCNGFDSTDGRLIDPIAERAALSSPDLASTSWLESSSNPQSKNYLKADNHLGIALLLGLPEPQASAHTGSTHAASAQTSEVARQSISNTTLVRNLTPQDFDPFLSAAPNTGAQLHISREILKSASRLDCQIGIASELLAAPYLRIRVKGFLRSAAAEAIGSVVPACLDDKTPANSMVLPATPPCLKATSTWSKFEISELLTTNTPNSNHNSQSILTGNPNRLSVALFPGQWEQVREYGADRHAGEIYFKDLSVEMEPLYLPPIDNSRLYVY